MPFFNYQQNNSFGYFLPPKKTVIVEADDENEANELATTVGVYFDGVKNGKDCPCCGNRWARNWNDPTDQPEIYGDPVKESDNCLILRKSSN